MSRRARVPEVLEALGAALVAVGFGFLWVPLGFFVAGLFLLAAANAPGAGRSRVTPLRRSGPPADRIAR